MGNKSKLNTMTEKEALFVIDIQRGKLDMIRKRIKVEETTKTYIEQASFEYQTDRALGFVEKAELLLSLLEYKVTARVGCAVYESSIGFDLEEYIAEAVKEDMAAIAPLIISARIIAENAASMINGYPVSCINGEVV